MYKEEEEEEEECVFYAIFQPFKKGYAVSFHSWRNKVFLGVNLQSSVSNWQLHVIGFEPEPQRRGRVVSKRHALITRQRRPLQKKCVCVCVCVCIWRVDTHTHTQTHKHTHTHTHTYNVYEKYKIILHYSAFHYNALLCFLSFNKHVLAKLRYFAISVINAIDDSIDV